MPDTDYYQWIINQGAIIRNVHLGEQYAQCVGLDRSGRVVARLWHHDHKLWTKKRSIFEDEFIRIATDEDEAKFQPKL